MVNALNSDMPGFNFAASLTDLMGTATHAMLAAQGEEALQHAMFSVPQIAMFGEPRVKRFVDEFINYETYLKQEEDPMVESAAGARA